MTLRAEAAVVVTLSCCPDDLFGTSQYEPKPVKVTLIPGSPHPGDGPWTFGWPTAPPAAAMARHDLPVSLGDADLAYVDEWVDRGWLGTDRPSVVRALIFRLHESLRAS